MNEDEIIRTRLRFREALRAGMTTPAASAYANDNFRCSTQAALASESASVVGRGNVQGGSGESNGSGAAPPPKLALARASENTGHDERTVSAPGRCTENKVGRARLPNGRWPAGISGNPKGRKRKAPLLLPDLKRAFDQAMSEKVTITQGDKKMNLTKWEAGFKQLANQHAKGDRHVRREAVGYAEKFDSDLIAGQHKASPEGIAEAARSSSDLTLSEEVLDRLSAETLDEIIRVMNEVTAENKKKID